MNKHNIILFREHTTTLLLSFPGPGTGLDCVHLMFPEVHGTVGLVAAGSRDYRVYVWRRRGSQGQRGREEYSRSMRGNIMYRMDGHKVH